jgi:hypothetical protein
VESGIEIPKPTGIQKWMEESRGFFVEQDWPDESALQKLFKEHNTADEDLLSAE